MQDGHPRSPAAASTGPTTDGGRSDRLATIRDRLRRLELEAVGFWWPRAADRGNGGFYGRIDRQGLPTSPTEKSIVQQARHSPRHPGAPR